MTAVDDLDRNPAEGVRLAVSRAAGAAVALAEIKQQLATARPSFILLFLPSRLQPDDIAEAVRSSLADKVVFGCTTAGQITARGYEDDALLAIAFERRHFRVASALFHPISPVSIADVVSQTERLASQFRATPGRKRLALVFADGLSKQEDILMAALEVGLKDIPVFGGSAGDGLRFEHTQVLHNGEFHSDAALLLLLETDLAFSGLGFDHFQPTDVRMVVTRAIPEERLVLEINGSPAAEEYARLVKVPVAELSPMTFAENPVLVRNRNLYHVRAIQQIHGEHGLTFLSAIDDGLLLTLGRGKEIIRTLDSGLAVSDKDGEAPDFILGFDCYLRKLEIERKGLDREASEQFRQRRVVGFNTYGEQHLGVHVNQTFVGVAFFRPKGGAPL
ncbi:FIST signal transduction protein [Sinorhizobium fredii]|uniref:FIST signal transduction protein n=1 Tax=Rhizobium fredii TaxID=380 RepID=UPI001296E04C|nr:FIST signal transduction protein [Sinorhizobium fredii]MQW95853.1 FIST signal transduction protein [Sinorhizobium fredii]UTY46422.1 FIST signal transduction protein [Sinorhizobium fredii]